jgi:hypothetical protein
MPVVTAPRSAAANAENGQQAIPPLPLSPIRVQSAPDLVLPRSPTPLDYLARTRELDAMMAEVFNRISELEVQMSQIQAQVPFIRESGINSAVRVTSTEDRISQLELSMSQALRRGSGIPEADLSGGIHRSGDAPPIGQNDPSDLGEDAPRSSNAKSKTKSKKSSRAPSRRKTLSRSGARANKRPDNSESSASGSDTDSVASFSSAELEERPPAAETTLGPPVAGLLEIVPSRSDYKTLVSYRNYRLLNLSQEFGPKVTGRLTGFARRLQHSMDEKFSGDTPVGILSFLRSFKEAADHNRISEGAAARLIPYFLTGIAKEGYRTHFKEIPVGAAIYPHMVQYLLATYARDDELSKAYHAVTSAKQATGEDEQSFARRLQSAAMIAGSVVDKANLKTIFVEGLQPHLQSDVRLHVKPAMTFEEVKHVAQTVGDSKRHALAMLPFALAKVRTPSGVKPLVRNLSAAHAVDEEDFLEGSAGSSEISRVRDDFQVVLAETPYPARGGSPGTSSWSPGSPAPSVVFPTRGWSSPNASVASRQPGPIAPTGWVPPVDRARADIPRQGQPPLCFVCYRTGHLLAECPLLPEEARREAIANRDRYYRESTPNRANTMPYGRNLPVSSRPPREAPLRGYSPPPRYQARRGPDRDGRDQVHSVNEDEAEVSERVPVELEAMPEIPLPQLRSKNEEGGV